MKIIQQNEQITQFLIFTIKIENFNANHVTLEKAWIEPIFYITPTHLLQNNLLLSKNENEHQFAMTLKCNNEKDSKKQTKLPISLDYSYFHHYQLYSSTPKEIPTYEYLINIPILDCTSYFVTFQLPLSEYNSIKEFIEISTLTLTKHKPINPILELEI